MKSAGVGGDAVTSAPLFFWDFYEAKISAVLIGIPIYTDISDAITFLPPGQDCFACKTSRRLVSNFCKRFSLRSPIKAYEQFETLGFAEAIKEYICHISAETLLKLEL